MNLTLIVVFLITLSCLALAFVAFVMATDPNRSEKQRQALEEYRARTMEMLHEFAGVAAQLSVRETDELRLVLGQLTSDRDRLLTALLAASTNPQAAITVGRVDEAMARATVHRRPDSVADLLEEDLRRRASETEFHDERGEAIVPVGLAQ